LVATTVPNRNTILFMTFGIIVALIIGSIFAQPALFPFGQKYQNLKLSIFGGYILMFWIVQFIFLRSIGRVNKIIKVTALRKFRITEIHKAVSICQVIIGGLLIWIFLQILFTDSYDSLLFGAIVWITHLSTIGLLLILLKHFFSWSTSNK